MDSTRRQLLAGSLAGLLAGPSLVQAQAQSQSQSHATAATEAARAALRRLIGPAADALVLSIRPAERPFWHVAGDETRILVEGDCPVSLVRGVVSALTDAGAIHVAWDARRVAPDALKALHGQQARAQSPYRHRAYLNPCTYGYTTPYWDFARWELEIDWMAAHGIDMPLAMEGQEYVWRALWQEEGLAPAALSAYFSGPAFMPWQRMGNIEGYRGPVPDAYLLDRRDLQRRILARLRGLGMQPVLPGFAGYVPKAFARRHPQARIYRMIPWGGFQETYWLDPADPLFARLSSRYLDLYEQTYGPGTHWLVDAFNEMLPPVSATQPERSPDGFLHAKEPEADLPAAQRDAALARYGQALHGALSQARPSAVFVMQGWMFGFQAKFWSPSAIAAFLSGMPDERSLVLDLANDTYPGGWERAKAFAGKPWLFGYVQNFGGNNPLTGDLSLYQRDLTGLPRRTDTGRLSGIGLFPEGLHANPLVYAYVLDQAWAPSDEALDDWIARYARSRYGSTDPALARALQGVAALFYRTRNWDFGWQGGFGTYLLCKRPSADKASLAHPQDPAQVRRVLAELLALWPQHGDNPLWRRDAVSVLVHGASLWVDGQLTHAIKAHLAGRVAEGDAHWAVAHAQISDLDLLLGELPDSLASWLTQARDQGRTPQESAYHVDNALAQVTVWGGDHVLNDYASKAWQGLYEDFYAARWSLFFDVLRRDGPSLDTAQMSQRMAAFDADFVRAGRLPALRRAHDARTVAERVLARIAT